MELFSFFTEELGAREKSEQGTSCGFVRCSSLSTYAQSDQESRLEAQGKFLALLLGDKAHLLTETIQ